MSDTKETTKQTPIKESLTTDLFINDHLLSEGVIFEVEDTDEV